MRIPPYWAQARHQGKDARGRTHAFTACGWSFSSLREAQEEALARAIRVFERVTSGQPPGRYEYHDRPIKEEIVQEVRDAVTVIALVTRNRYGALVLNCSNVLFVDVDLPALRPSGLVDALLLAFSRRRREVRREALAQAAIGQVEQWAAGHPDRRFRLYRTKEGLRLLFTDRPYEPTSPETTAILAELKADPLYVKLTQKQECFRARLTAKPWRCGCPSPPGGYPWLSSEAERAFRQWERTYAERDAGFRVCDLVREFGSPAASGAVRTIVALHDRETRVTARAPLA